MMISRLTQPLFARFSGCVVLCVAMVSAAHATHADAPATDTGAATPVTQPVFALPNTENNAENDAKAAVDDAAVEKMQTAPQDAALQNQAEVEEVPENSVLTETKSAPSVVSFQQLLVLKNRALAEFEKHGVDILPQTFSSSAPRAPSAPRARASSTTHAAPVSSSHAVLHPPANNTPVTHTPRVRFTQRWLQPIGVSLALLALASVWIGWVFFHRRRTTRAVFLKPLKLDFDLDLPSDLPPLPATALSGDNALARVARDRLKQACVHIEQGDSAGALALINAVIQLHRSDQE